MATLKTSSTIIGEVLECVQKYDSRKVNIIALDGTPYVQTPSAAIDRRTISVYCATVALKNTLNTASNNGSILIIDNWMGNIIRGYIEKDVTWKEWQDGHAVGRFVLLVKEVVASA